MKNLITTILTAIILMAGSCKTAVEPEAEPEPGRRDYVWTVDTIKVYGGINHGIYAVDTNNIWIAFVGSYDQKLLHNNGKKWEPVYLSGNYQPSRICGNSTNDIWILPDIGNSYHFNGLDWEQIKITNTTKYEIITLYQLTWGKDGEIFAAGSGTNKDYSNPRGVIAKYEKGNWVFIDIPEIEGDFVNITFDITTNSYYILCWPRENNHIIYSFDGRNIKQLVEGVSIGNREIGKKTYFNINGYIYTFVNNKLEKFIEESIEVNNRFSMYGRNKNDFFVTPVGYIRHYNGTDIKTLVNLPKDQIMGPFVSIGKNVAAFVTFNGYNYYIYIGKLK